MWYTSKITGIRRGKVSTKNVPADATEEPYQSNLPTAMLSFQLETSRALEEKIEDEMNNADMFEHGRYKAPPLIRYTCG